MDFRLHLSFTDFQLKNLGFIDFKLKQQFPVNYSRINERYIKRDIEMPQTLLQTFEEKGSAEEENLTVLNLNSLFMAYFKS